MLNGRRNDNLLWKMYGKFRSFRFVKEFEASAAYEGL
jgi:hypothetical protein